MIRLPPLPLPWVLASLSLVACGHTAPTTLHALVAMPSARRVAYTGPPISVGLVKLPPAIDRIDVLRESGVGRYRVLEFDRWAALPSRLARQTLAEDLSLRLPPAMVVTAPQAGGAPVIMISVDVLSFSATPAGSTMSANWTCVAQTGADPSYRHARLEAAGGDAPAALTSLTAELADVIAAELAMSRNGCPVAG